MSVETPTLDQMAIDLQKAYREIDTIKDNAVALARETGTAHGLLLQQIADLERRLDADEEVMRKMVRGALGDD